MSVIVFFLTMFELILFWQIIIIIAKITIIVVQLPNLLHICVACLWPLLASAFRAFSINLTLVVSACSLSFYCDLPLAATVSVNSLPVTGLWFDLAGVNSVWFMTVYTFGTVDNSFIISSGNGFTKCKVYRSYYILI